MGYLDLAKLYLKKHLPPKVSTPTEAADGGAHPIPTKVSLSDDEENEINEERLAARHESKSGRVQLGDFEWSFDEGSEPHIEIIDTAICADETRELIEWFTANKNRFPDAPFTLRRGTRVVDPCRFYAGLKSDIDAGPGGVRAALGALAADLHDLRSAVEARW
jgi:hypothetical protein